MKVQSIKNGLRFVWNDGTTLYFIKGIWEVGQSGYHRVYGDTKTKAQARYDAIPVEGLTKVMNAEQENLKNTKPCPHAPDVPCVQYPEDDPCGCDPCDECEHKPKSNKRIGIIGSRRRNETADYAKVLAVFFDVWNKGDTIISGGCPKGGDKFAEMIAGNYNIPIKIFKPDWSMGKHAGFVRNTDIAMYSDVLIACVSPDRRGGTEDTIKKFKRMYPDKTVHIVI